MKTLKPFEYGEVLFDSILDIAHVDDTREAKLQRRASHRHHLDIDQHNIHLYKGNGARDFDLETSESQDWEKQKLYNKRLRANNQTAINPWNHINPDFVGPLNISQEILAVLFEPEQTETDWENQYLNDAYDVAIDTVDDESFGDKVQIGISYQVKNTKRWKKPIQFKPSQVIVRDADGWLVDTIEYDKAGEPVTSCFDPEKYAAHVTHSAHIRATHDVPEIVDTRGRIRSKALLLSVREYSKTLNGGVVQHSAKSKAERIESGMSKAMARRLAALEARAKLNS